MEILTINRQDVPTMYRWQDELKSSFREVDSLLKYVELDRDDLPGQLQENQARFPLLVPRPYAGRIKKGDPNDPLLRQVLNWEDQNGAVEDIGADWSADPVADKSFERVPGLLHKYHGRVLLLLTGACAVHCRYCFRQNFDYSSVHSDFGPALSYLEQNPSVSEVILSGGDPLMRTDAILSGLLDRLEKIPHIRRIRIHTRTPVVLPSRVNDELIQALTGRRQSVTVVLHINHANEVDDEVRQMIDRLRTNRILVLNQAVLLRNINSDFDSQKNLCETLVESGVIPYYLHCFDQVKGAERYFVSDELGVSLISRLRQSLPGYAVPRLVREIPGEPNKTPVVE